MRIVLVGGAVVESRPRDQAPGDAVAEQLKAVGDKVSRLVSDHVELAKAELRASAKKAGRDAALVGVGVGLLLVGYVLLMVSLSVGLGEVLGLARGFLVVSAVHVVVGLVLSRVFAKRLQGEDRPGAPRTVEVIAEDRRFVSRIKGELRHGR